MKTIFQILAEAPLYDKEPEPELTDLLPAEHIHINRHKKKKDDSKNDEDIKDKKKRFSRQPVVMKNGKRLTPVGPADDWLNRQRRREAYDRQRQDAEPISKKESKPLKFKSIDVRNRTFIPNAPEGKRAAPRFTVPIKPKYQAPKDYKLPRELKPGETVADDPLHYAKKAEKKREVMKKIIKKHRNETDRKEKKRLEKRIKKMQKFIKILDDKAAKGELRIFKNKGKERKKNLKEGILRSLFPSRKQKAFDQRKAEHIDKQVNASNNHYRQAKAAYDSYRQGHDRYHNINNAPDRINRKKEKMAAFKSYVDDYNAHQHHADRVRSLNHSALGWASGKKEKAIKKFFGR